jgi:glycosyltransferase involved in cell wall biosynthesis
MKVVFSHGLPFSLAHGGLQTLIESLMKELALLGVDVEPEKWWDPSQTSDILHFVQRPHQGNVLLAMQKGRKTIMTENFDVVASESRPRLFTRAFATRVARKLMPNFDSRLSFYRDLDAIVYVVPHEWDAVQQIYNLPSDKGFIIPHGLDPSALEALAGVQIEGDYLASVGTISPRKNSILLAASARKAKVPVVFVGKPFSDNDPYFRRFQDLIDNKYVRYAGYVVENEKYRILRGARGFALLSRGESGCIAVYEAAAAGLPLLLSDLPWAAKGYPQSDRLHLVALGSVSAIANRLESFYESAHRGPTATFPVGTWADVAKMYFSVYQKIYSRGNAISLSVGMEGAGKRAMDRTGAAVSEKRLA